MYYSRARYLNPTTGRFCTMDLYEPNPDEPFKLHKYLYCEANPVNGTDSRGLWTDYGVGMADPDFHFTGGPTAPQIVNRLGGPDVTRILNRTLANVYTTFTNWPPSLQESAVARVTGFLAGNAWEIVQLHDIAPPVQNTLSFGATRYVCGEGDYQGTVGVNREAFYADAVNFAIYGKMYRIAHDWALSQGQYVSAATFSLPVAKDIARVWKAVRYLDVGEHYREAAAFVEYGYRGDGKVPSTGLACSVTGEVTADLFDWIWEPAKPH